MTEWMVNGWRDHDGSGMPVDPDVMVLVRTQDGEESEIPITAAEWGQAPEFENPIGEGRSWWIHHGEDYDIIAYKVIEK